MRVQDSSISRNRRIGGNFLIGLSSLMLVGSAAAKFAHVPKLVTEFAAMGFDNKRLMFVAILEIVSAAAFLIPATRSFGLLLVSSYMGGAIATHLQHGQTIAQPSFVLALVWLGAWLRHPEILRSWGKNANTANTVPYQEQRKSAAHGI